MSRSPTVATPPPASAFAVFLGRRRDSGMSSALTRRTPRPGSARSAHHPTSPGRSSRTHHAWRAAGAPSPPCRDHHRRERQAAATTVLPRAQPRPMPRRSLRDPRRAVAGRSSTSTARRGHRRAASARASEPPRGHLAAGRREERTRGRPRGRRDHRCWLHAGSQARRELEREEQRQRYRPGRRWPRRRGQRASRPCANLLRRRHRPRRSGSGPGKRRLLRVRVLRRGRGHGCTR